MAHFPLFPGLLILAATAAAPALAQTRYTNDTGGSAEFGGQINPSYVSVDDGEDSYGELTDSAASNTRAGFKLDQELENGGRVSLRVETALGFRQSSAISQTDTPDAFYWDRTRLRWVDLQYRSPKFGTLYLGQGSMSADGISRFDMSGTTLANGVAIAGDMAGGYAFRNSDGTLSGISVSDVLSDFDASRRGRIRYDTPDLAGFTLSASYGKDILSLDTSREDWYTGAHVAYDKSFANDTRFQAGVGFQRRERKPDNGSSTTRDDLYASAAVRFASGFNLAGALGTRDTEGRDFDASYYYLKAGYIADDLLSIGSTAFSVDYFAGSDYVQKGDESTAWGVGVVQNVSKLNAEIYLGYRKLGYDQSSSNFKDMDVVFVGTRVKF